MEISITKENLLNLLSKPQNIVEKRNTMPILMNVLLSAEKDSLRVFATNLEVSLTDETEAQIKAEGKLAVNGKNLFDIVKELPDGEIKLKKQENNWLRIKQGKSIFNIVGTNPEEYPVFPTYKTKDFMEIDKKTFSEMVEKTIYSVSNDETRYHLNGVYFEKKSEESAKPSFRMVATDGHRLSLVNRTMENDSSSYQTSSQGVIIPRKGLYEIKKLVDSVKESISMTIEGSQLIVKTGTTVLMIRLIEGNYPNYKQFIPKDLKETAVINRNTFMASLKRVSLLSNQKSKSVTFSLSKGLLEISSNNPELGDAKEEIEINYTGKEMKIGFNARFILDLLSSMEVDNINLELKDQLSPALFRPNEDKNYTCIVMPMRI